MDQPKSNPKCEDVMREVVEKANSLFDHIKDAETVIQDCERLGVNSNTDYIQAYKDWLSLAKARFEMMREEFQHLFANAPGAAHRLKLSQLNKLFGDNGIGLEDDMEQEGGSLPENDDEEESLRA